MNYIEELTNPLDLFDKELMKYYKDDNYAIAKTPYQKAINKIHALLTDERKILEQNSTVLFLKDD